MYSPGRLHLCHLSLPLPVDMLYKSHRWFLGSVFIKGLKSTWACNPRVNIHIHILALNTSRSRDLTGLYLTRLLHSNSSHLKWTVALLGSISNRWTSLAALNCYGDSGRGHLGTALLICHKKILEGGNVSCRWKV